MPLVSSAQLHFSFSFWLGVKKKVWSKVEKNRVGHQSGDCKERLFGCCWGFFGLFFFVLFLSKHALNKEGCALYNRQTFTDIHHHYSQTHQMLSVTFSTSETDLCLFTVLCTLVVTVAYNFLEITGSLAL